jgi:hypothetical protein
MALFFNLEALEKESDNVTDKFLALLEYHYSKRLPKNVYSKHKPSKANLNGSSFILNPGPLFRSDCDPVFKVQYIKLAGRRDYLLYKNYRIVTLDLSLYPDLDLEKIKHNPLLIINNKQIKFKFEENINGYQVR